MPIQTFIFLGFQENKEIKLYLRQSQKWKESLVTKETLLIETQWQEKEYIGRFIPSKVSYAQIKEFEESIKSQLQLYCPKLNLDKHHFYLFPQILIG